LLAANCGGNDVIDAADASTDAMSDSGRLEDALDASLADRSGETSSDDSSFPDVSVDVDGTESGPRDAGESEVESGVPVLALATAATFAVFASATITNAGVTTEVIGDVGISPGTALVNLPPGQVMGTIHLGDGPAAQAASDLAVAYADLAARPCQHTISGTDLGGQTLAPGVYCFAAGAAQSAADLTLDGQNDPNASWVFQIGSTLTIATNAVTKVINGGSACNAYWQVGSSGTINAGARFKGSVLAKVSITLLTGASVSPGRILAETGAVTLDSNALSNAGCP
jgi:hypothetical protein